MSNEQLRDFTEDGKLNGQSLEDKSNDNNVSDVVNEILLIENKSYKGNVINLPNRYVVNHLGKTREMYLNPNNAEELILVSSNKISAHNIVHIGDITSKGRLITQISKFWVKELKNNQSTSHIKTQIVENPVWPEDFPAHLKERSIIIKKLKPIPIEAIVRGYLYGSALAGYDDEVGLLKTFESVGKGLSKCSKFYSPIFTPSTKDFSGDENITIIGMIVNLDIWLKCNGYHIVDTTILAEEIIHNSISMYEYAHSRADEKGFIIGDTKFEFGLDKDGNLFVIDEILTPESSHFWLKDGFQVGVEPKSKDKQVIRDYVINYWKENPDENGKKYIERGFKKYPVNLPEHIIEECGNKCNEMSIVFN